MPGYLFFSPSPSPLCCVMFNSLLVSQAAVCPWCKAHRLEPLSSPEGDSLWREIDGEIITGKETRSINKNSVVSYSDTSSYCVGFIGPVLLLFLFQWGSEIALYGVRKGGTVVSATRVGCARQTDTWGYLGNIDSWITADKLCLYKLFSVCPDQSCLTARLQRYFSLKYSTGCWSTWSTRPDLVAPCCFLGLYRICQSPPSTQGRRN